jgi:hypothetical protein
MFEQCVIFAGDPPMIGQKTNSLDSEARKFVLLVNSLLVAPTTITTMSVEPMTSIEAVASIVATMPREASGSTVCPAELLDARMLNSGACAW